MKSNYGDMRRREFLTAVGRAVGGSAMLKTMAAMGIGASIAGCGSSSAAPGSPFESLFGPLAGARSEAAAMSGLYKSLQRTAPEVANQLKNLELINLLSKEPALTLLPFKINVR